MSTYLPISSTHSIDSGGGRGLVSINHKASLLWQARIARQAFFIAKGGIPDLRAGAISTSHDLGKHFPCAALMSPAKRGTGGDLGQRRAYPRHRFEASPSYNP